MIRFTYPHTTDEARQIEEHLRSLGIDGVFNPSVMRQGEKLFITFRAPSKNTLNPKMDAYLFETDKSFTNPKVSRLELLIGANFTIADPKLFSLENEVWVTFNTGYHQIENQLYIARIFPAPSRATLCVFDKRLPVEKNWAFFRYKGEFACVYALSPLIILISERGLSDGQVTLRFNEFFCDLNSKDRDLSIGTQLLKIEHDYYFLAHRKYRFINKRIYFGVAARLASIEKDQFRLSLSKSLLFHSPRAILGSRPRWNPNLWACTYFSGLTNSNQDPNKVLVGYGINDNDFAIRAIERNLMWNT